LLNLGICKQVDYSKLKNKNCYQRTYNHAQIQRGLALKKYYLAKGFKGDALNEVLNINIIAENDPVDIRGNEIEKQLKQQGVPDSDIEKEVIRILKQEGY